MSSDTPVVTTPLVTPSERLVGRVKWFNNKSGYGFITVSEGARANTDIFVHHSGVVVNSEQYKYLVQGEYVSFQLIHTPSGAHEYQAGDVSGINGGKLMCETRREFRQTRVTRSPDESVDVKPPMSSRPPRAEGSSIRARGSGPREGGEWTMVKEGRSKKVFEGQEKSTPSTTVAGGRGRGRPPRSNVKQNE